MHESSVPHDVDIADIDGIGRGSFAQVGRVKNSGYALKVASRDAPEHFVRERKVYERLGCHANILQFYGEARVHSSERTLQGILLEYHSAGTLDKMLSTCDLKAQRSGWPKQAIEAVRYVHSRGVVHGDLGCHNFLVKSDWSLVLSDFGGSSIDGSKYLEFPPARYSRPKIASHHQEPTVKDDLFALGTVLYEISTSRVLYQDLDDNHIKTRFIQHEYPGFADVPAAFKHVIICCWTGKFANADEVARDLDGLRASSGWPLGISLIAFGFISTILAVMVVVGTRRLDFSKW